MTATQVFLRFLRETCTYDEYLFFGNIISNNCGNKYFRKRPLFKKNFVEGYLSRNNRHLGNFMIRLFILAPNLVNNRHFNPRYAYIMKKFGRNKNCYQLKNIYVSFYRRRWYAWLETRIEKGGKSIYSPFKKGDEYDFKLNDSMTHFGFRKSWNDME